MANLIIALNLLILAFGVRPIESNPPKYDSIVVVQVDNLAGDLYQQVSTEMSSDPTAHIEYACMWSGVMVIKLLNSTIATKGDAQMYIRTRFGPGANLEFLHVHQEQTSGSTSARNEKSGDQNRSEIR